VDPPSGRCWVYTEDRFEELKADNRVWFGEDGGNVPLNAAAQSERVGRSPGEHPVASGFFVHHVGLTVDLPCLKLSAALSGIAGMLPE
jgi:hypothetical protein